MKKHVKTTLLIALSLFATLAAIPIRANADAPNPTGTLARGDWWKYNLQINNFRSPPVTIPLVGTFSLIANLTGTTTETLVGEQSITAGGTSYDSYRLDLSGSGTLIGTAAGRPLTGTWTTTGSSYELKTDLSQIRATTTIQVSAQVNVFSVSAIIATNTTVSPPEQTYKFPLATGESWPTTGEISTNVTLFTSFSARPNSTLIRTALQETHRVTSTQITSVPAGAYQTLLVEALNSSGSHSDSYYSPQVENSVETIMYNATGYPALTMTLEDYNAWPFKASLNVEKNSQAFGILISTDVASSNTHADMVSITFQVSGPDGVTGRANISIPTQINSTDLKVAVDGAQAVATVSQNTTHYQVLFSFPLTTHTIILTYSTSGSLISIVLAAGIAVGAIILTAYLVAFRMNRLRRRFAPRPSPITPEQTPPAPPSISARVPGWDWPLY